MTRASLLKLFAIAILVFPVVACSGLQSYSSVSGANINGSSATPAKTSGGAVSREEYEHSAAFPPG